jgi:molecular chaperone DnaJ
MANAAPDDHYAVLGVDDDVSDADLRRAFRQLALKWHPDRAGPATTATFQRMAAAYSVLSDPIRRARYDLWRAARGLGRPKPPPSPVSGRAPGRMIERLSGPLAGLLATGAARYAGPDVLELFLSREEAAIGGMITIAMRVPVDCPACMPEPVGPCDLCGSTRMVEDLFSAWLAVSPGIADGTVLHPSALLKGMVRPVSFRMRILPAR